MPTVPMRGSGSTTNPDLYKAVPESEWLNKNSVANKTVFRLTYICCSFRFIWLEFQHPSKLDLSDQTHTIKQNKCPRYFFLIQLALAANKYALEERGSRCWACSLALWTEIWDPLQAAALLFLIDVAESNYLQVFMTAANPMPAPVSLTLTSNYVCPPLNTPDMGFIEHCSDWQGMEKIYKLTISEEDLNLHNSKSAQQGGRLFLCLSPPTLWIPTSLPQSSPPLSKFSGKAAWPCWQDSKLQ